MEVDSGTDSADWDTHSDYSDRHWPAGLAEDIDFGERRSIPGLRFVDWDRPDCWKRDFLVVLGLGTGYLDWEYSRRIGAVGFDRDHTVVESSLGKMGIPGMGDSLVPFGSVGWDTRVVELRPVECKD